MPTEDHYYSVNLEDIKPSPHEQDNLFYFFMSFILEMDAFKAIQSLKIIIEEQNSSK